MAEAETLRDAQEKLAQASLLARKAQILHVLKTKLGRLGCIKLSEALCEDMFGKNVPYWLCDLVKSAISNGCEGHAVELELEAASFAQDAMMLIQGETLDNQ
jgi:hypothetical protein